MKQFWVTSGGKESVEAEASQGMSITITTRSCGYQQTVNKARGVEK